jgi:hypothetical protein
VSEQATITQVRLTASTRSGHIGQFDTLVSYELTGKGRFTVLVNGDKPTLAEIDSGITTDVRVRGQLIGRVVSV